jgi:hypothetical protein
VEAEVRNPVQQIARIMRAICFCVAVGMAAGPVVAFETPPAEAGGVCQSYMDAGESPHAMAIRLVMAQRAHEIAALDARDEEQSKEHSAWFDARRRTWATVRLLPVGAYLDTRHMLVVEYLIEDVQVAKWHVDLAAQRVFDKGEVFSPCRN